MKSSIEVIFFSGQLVLVGGPNAISKRGSYRLKRIQAVHPQIRLGKEIVKRATVAVLNTLVLLKLSIFLAA